MDTETRLGERCQALEVLISSIYPFYTSATNNQKAFIETIIGAGIWYLPHGKAYWNNKVSKKAIEELKKNAKSRLTRDHIFPRKKSAKQLLSEIDQISGNGEFLKERYNSELGKYVLVTPKENRNLVKIEKRNPNATWQEVYDNAGIELVDYQTILADEKEEFVRLLNKKH